MNRAILPAFILALAPALARAEFPEKVTIGGKTIECRTAEDIRKLGLECEEIPWKDNAARVLIDAMNFYKDPASPELGHVLDDGARTLHFGEQAEDVSKFLEGNKQVFQLLRQADGMPRYEFPMHRAQNLAETKLPPLSRFQRLGRLLAYKAAWDFSTGRSKDAVDESFLAFRLGARVQTGPFLITWMVGSALETIAMKSLEGMTLSGKLDEPTLKDIAERLDKSGAMGDLTRAFRSSRISFMEMFETIEKLPPEQQAETLERYAIQGVEPGEKLNVVRKNLSEVYDFYDALAKKPVTEALKRENTFEAFRKEHEKDWDPLTRAHAKALDKMFLNCARGQVMFNALQLRIALERFRLAGGAYPKDLAELAPAYLDKLPPDPFSGKPFGYRVEADGHFLFWSVGEDLKDDGGKGDPDPPNAGPDIVFTSRPKAPVQVQETPFGPAPGPKPLGP